MGELHMSMVRLNKHLHTSVVPEIKKVKKTKGFAFGSVCTGADPSNWFSSEGSGDDEDEDDEEEGRPPDLGELNQRDAEIRALQDDLKSMKKEHKDAEQRHKKELKDLHDAN